MKPESAGDTVSAAANAERVRFDKWLWAARFYKTRALAAQAIDSGQARLNSQHVKPAHTIRAGDMVSVRKHGMIWEIAVTDVSDRRGSAPEAAKLYQETASSTATRESELQQRRAAAAMEQRFTGRPTKRQRRKLEDFLNEP